MAALRNCEKTETHQFHGWEQTADNGATSYFVCEGVKQPHPYEWDGIYRSNDFLFCVCGDIEARHNTPGNDVA